MAKKQTRKRKIKTIDSPLLKALVLALLIVAVVVALLTSMGYKDQKQSKKRLSKNKTEKPITTNEEQPFSAALQTTTPFKIVGLALPYTADTTMIRTNKTGRYALNYSPKHRGALWVAYILTQKEVQTKGTNRKDNFRTDPSLNSVTQATLLDYKKSGYDRGHLLPSADRDDTPEENSETFLLSNISPQAPGLNRGTWSLLEAAVRRWANKYDTLYVVTGGVLTPNPIKPYRIIGDSVTVPNYFYKAILTKSDLGYISTAYLIPNLDDVDRNYNTYQITVDSLENILGIDLFFALPNLLEKEAERKATNLSE